MTVSVKTVLVCGGAGYIGSHMVRMLAEHGYAPVVYDDFSTGHADAVSAHPVVRGALADTVALTRAFTIYRPAAVMHFAGKIQVGESVLAPLMYYQNNVAGSLSLLAAMKRHGVSSIVFSSSAAVYGMPRNQARSLTETHPLAPINPYGVTKKQTEEMLADCARAYGIRAACLRYFNAAGAHVGADIGESHSPETHLIPCALRAVLGTGPALTVFGDEYPTPDGTCIRDYVHVQDLCRAHLLALQALDKHDPSTGVLAYNIGTGTGYSVKAVIDMAERVSGRKVPFSMGPRRAGDPAYLVADSGKIQREHGWTLEESSLERILESAWRWHVNPRY